MHVPRKVLKDELERTTSSMDEYLMSGELNPFARLLNLAIDGATEMIRTDCTEKEFKMSSKMFLQVMLPSAIWRRNYSNIKLSSFITIADELFAYLCLENKVEEWIKGKETHL